LRAEKTRYSEYEEEYDIDSDYNGVLTGKDSDESNNVSGQPPFEFNEGDAGHLAASDPSSAQLFMSEFEKSLTRRQKMMFADVMKGIARSVERNSLNGASGDTEDHSYAEAGK